MTTTTMTMTSPGSAAALNPATSYAEVADAVWRYQNAVAHADRPALGALLWPIWNGKRLAAANGDLAVESKEARIAHIIDGGQSDGDAHGALMSVQAFFDDFAVARSDDWKRLSTTIYTLFKLDGAWRIAGEASTTAAAGTRQAQYNPATAEAEVLRVLDGYYRAVVDGDADALEQIFHPHWHMKNHEDGDVVCEGKAAFQARIRNTPLKTYANDRQIADVQIAWDRMATVRVDKPSSGGVTVFVFFRVGKAWLIVDKAWSVAKN
jgi:hypothetical protein